MEETGATNPKHQPLRVYGACLCADAQKATPWHQFIRLLDKYVVPCCVKNH